MAAISFTIVLIGAALLTSVISFPVNIAGELLIGGANGQLKTGNLATFPLDLVDGSEAIAATHDRSHNDLLLTLAEVMGTPMTTFGEPTYCTGPISEILASS